MQSSGKGVSLRTIHAFAERGKGMEQLLSVQTLAGSMRDQNHACH